MLYLLNLQFHCMVISADVVHYHPGIVNLYKPYGLRQKVFSIKEFFDTVLGIL
jgi:hypothetical protein